MCRCVVASVLAILPLCASAVSYDLAADWSDANNPNGTWTYGLLNGGATTSPFGMHVANYINVGPPAFTSPQPAWTRCANTGNNGCPEGLAKSLGVAVAPLDFPIGRVGGHTPVSGALSVTWAAPADGTIDVSGGTWMWADYAGRREVTSLFLNGVALFSSVLIPTWGSGATSSSPYTFDQAITDFGGSAASLQGIHVSTGDTLTWAAAEAPGSVEWVVGIDMTVVLSPVPESSTVALLFVGAIVVLGAARRSRALRLNPGTRD